MDIFNECGPASPDLSALLSDLIAEHMDDASCEASASPHQHPVAAGQLPGDPSMNGDDTYSFATTFPTHQSTSTPYSAPSLGLVPQLGVPPADLHTAAEGRAIWPLQGGLAQAVPHASHAGAGWVGPPAFTPGLAPQPTDGGAHRRRSSGPTGIAAAAAATAAAAGAGGGSCRRGRPPKPRLPDLQVQVDALTEQFRRLSRENSFLRGKLKLLECVLPYRDSHIGFLASIKSGQPWQPVVQYWQQQQQPAEERAPGPAATVAHPAPGPAAALTGPGFTPGSSDLSSSGGVHRPRGAAVATASGDSGHFVGVTPIAAAPTAAVAAAVGSAAVPTAHGGDRIADRQAGGQGAARSLPSAPPSVPTAAACGSWSTAPSAHPPGTPAVLALCPGPDGEVPPITAAAVEELRRVTPREFQLLYKHFVTQVGVLVVAAEVHGPASPQQERLERFLDRAFLFMDQVLLLVPSCWVQSMYINLETGMPERPPDEFWRALAASLRLDGEQLEAIRMATQVHTASVAPVAAERIRLASELSASLEAAGLEAAAGRRQTVSSADVLQTLSEVDEVAERLRRNVIREHQAQMDIADFLCTRVVTPIQAARLMAASYPYLPDGVAIMHALESARNSGAPQQAHPPAGPGRSGADAGAAAVVVCGGGGGGGGA